MAIFDISVKMAVALWLLLQSQLRTVAPSLFYLPLTAIFWSYFSLYHLSFPGFVGYLWNSW